MGSAPLQPSFRLPFTLGADVHPDVAAGLRYTYNGLLDLNQAIAALVPKVNANTTVTQQVTNTVVSGGSPSPPPPALIIGQVNLQPVGGIDNYTTQTSDFGGLIVVNDTNPFTLNLNSGLVLPFFTSVQNLGTANVTLDATTGNVNGGSTVTVLPNQMAVAFFDGTNWWVMSPLLAQSIVHAAHNWLDSYNATTGVFTKSQPAAEDLSNGTTGGSGRKVVLDSGATSLNATFTGLTKIVLSQFANNAAAIAGGLAVGDLYRTGSDPDLVAVVH